MTATEQALSRAALYVGIGTSCVAVALLVDDVTGVVLFSGCAVLWAGLAAFFAFAPKAEG